MVVAVAGLVAVVTAGCGGGSDEADDTTTWSLRTPSTTCITWPDGSCLTPSLDSFDTPEKVLDLGEGLVEIHDTSALRDYNARLRQLDLAALSTSEQQALRELAEVDLKPGFASALWDDTARVFAEILRFLKP